MFFAAPCAMLASGIHSARVLPTGNAGRSDRGIQPPYAFDFGVGIVSLVLESDLPLRSVDPVVFAAKWGLVHQVDDGLCCVYCDGDSPLFCGRSSLEADRPRRNHARRSRADTVSRNYCDRWLRRGPDSARGNPLSGLDGTSFRRSPDRDQNLHHTGAVVVPVRIVDTWTCLGADHAGCGLVPEATGQTRCLVEASGPRCLHHGANKKLIVAPGRQAQK